MAFRSDTGTGSGRRFFFASQGTPQAMPQCVTAMFGPVLTRLALSSLSSLLFTLQIGTGESYKSLGLRK